VVGDALQRRADRARDVDAGALGVRAGLAVATMQADRAGELARDELELLARAGGALGIVEGLGLVDLLLQLADAGAVGRLRWLSSAGPASLSPRARTSMPAPTATAAASRPRSEVTPPTRSRA